MEEKNGIIPLDEITMADDGKELEMDGFADIIIAVGDKGQYVVLATLNNPHPSVQEELTMDQKLGDIDVDPGVYRAKFCAAFARGHDDEWDSSFDFEDIRRLADGADLPELLCPVTLEGDRAVPCAWCGATSVQVTVVYTDEMRNIGKARAECDCGHCGPYICGVLDMSIVHRILLAWNAVNTLA